MSSNLVELEREALGLLSGSRLSKSAASIDKQIKVTEEDNSSPDFRRAIEQPEIESPSDFGMKSSPKVQATQVIIPKSKIKTRKRKKKKKPAEK